MEDFNKFADFPAPLTVCDREGVVLFMNEASRRQFAKDGGSSLLGKNLLDCHSSASRKLIMEMIESGKSNTYSIEKGGKKKLVYQAPWYGTSRTGERVLGGLIEISISLPEGMRNIVRDASE
jgi:hypothetical protein